MCNNSARFFPWRVVMIAICFFAACIRNRFEFQKFILPNRANYANFLQTTFNMFVLKLLIWSIIIQHFSVSYQSEKEMLVVAVLALFWFSPRWSIFHGTEWNGTEQKSRNSWGINHGTELYFSYSKGWALHGPIMHS